MNKLKKHGLIINYHVINTKNKHSYIKVKNGFLEIHLSKKMSLEVVLNKINDNFESYYEKTRKVSEDEFILWGKKYQTQLKIGNFAYKILGDVIQITAPINYDYRSKIYHLELENYINSIKNEVVEILNKENIKWVLIKYRKLKSKFGSYQTKKHYITLNTLLASLPKEYSDYVLFHEYTHQKVFNHQKEFYELLAKLYPNYRNIEKNLRKAIIHF